MAGKTVVLDGDCQLIIPSAGELGVVTAIRKPYPTYTGETTVTPSDEAQVLHTELQTLINDITVEAVPGDYVGSDIPRRDSSDVAASGATVTAPAGYYEAAATKTIQSGTEGTPTATKGAVSNHAVSVTPSVTNTEGYINGGTKSGTAVTVSASELVSGTKEITENGQGIDVANYASVDVAVPSSDPNLQSKTNINPTTSSQTIEADPGYDGLSSVQINAMPNGTEGTPSASKGAVSNHSVSVTPSVTNTAGYISGGTKTGTAVTVTAAELESGAKAITANGNGQDVTGYAAVDVSVPNSYTASDEGKVVNNGALEAQSSATYTNNGTYDTTLKNSVIVSVPSQTPVINPLSVTANGTYTAPTGVDGYSPVTVNVQGGDEPIPTDGKTRLWINISDNMPDNRLTFYLNFTSSVANNTTVEWGDGTTETIGEIVATTWAHKYPTSGKYVIVMTANRGTISFGGSTNGQFAIYGSTSSENAYNRSRIYRIAFGDNIGSIGNYACYRNYGLREVVFTNTNTISELGMFSFNACYSLEKFVVPDSVTTIGNRAFSDAYNVKNYVISNNVTQIGTYFISSNFSITTLTIPQSVSSIGDYAFNSCLGLSEMHMLGQKPPTLGATTSTIAADLIIYVPFSADHSVLNAYKTAANWSNFASHIQEEPQ